MSPPAGTSRTCRSWSPPDGSDTSTRYFDAAKRNRLRYAVAAGVAAAAIPVATTASASAVVVATLGAVVLVATGVRTTFQLHENWVEHSRLRYDIEREAALFLVESPPYQGGNATRVLIDRVETLAYENGRRWAARRAQVGHAQNAFTAGG